MGVVPTPTVATTVLVAVSMTETLLSFWFVMYAKGASGRKRVPH